MDKLKYLPNALTQGLAMKTGLPRFEYAIKPSSAMNYDFYTAWRESKTEWSTWCNGWMLYDGALYVTREGF